MRTLHLFAGAGGGVLADLLLGHTPVCAVEIEPYCQRVLLQRQRDGILPRFPIWGDVRTFDGKPWRGHVDIVAGGFPCQDISAAGKGAGITGERSGLWREQARIISEVGPRYVLVENSPRLTIRGLGTVLGDLATLGFDARWGILSAAQCGAPHLRERIWILAHSRRFAGQGENIGRDGCCQLLPKTEDREASERGEDWKLSTLAPGIHPRGPAHWWRAQRAVDRSIDGMAYRLDRLRAAGNGQVPIVAATAWNLLKP